MFRMVYGGMFLKRLCIEVAQEHLFLNKLSSYKRSKSQQFLD